ncbi:DUF3237 domain-containing protein [Sphingomonas sp. PB4P5]|uniref:DUF3237 domain-containing protein n=1 Tax=Parasphingomonas puruogangriensis TaxID=3096155 RepID=UPI002FC6B7B6
MTTPITRRALVRASASAAVAAAALFAPAHAAAADAPALTFVFRLVVTLGVPVELGTVPTGRRRFIPITGGTVSGPKLSGIVLPGGGDWQTIGADGTTEIHARYALQASDGTVVEIDNPGVRVATPAIIARLTAGKDLDPALYYFRTTPRFSPTGAKHDWLRQRVFVAVGIRHPQTVEVNIYEVG